MSKRTLMGACLAVAVAFGTWTAATPASAQMGMWGPGYGPGMMFGQGSGPNRRGFGPGMMGGYGPGMMGGYGPGMMGGCPMMGFTDDGRAQTFVEGRIAFLRAELGVTEAQKASWEGYAEALKRNLQSMQSMWSAMSATFESNSPVDRLDAHVAAMESRLAALKDVKPALDKLYAALSAEQKKKADELLIGVGCMM